MKTSLKYAPGADPAMRRGRKDGNEAPKSDDDDREVKDMTDDEVVKALGDVSDQIKNFAEDAKKKMDAGESLTKEVKSDVDKLLVKQTELSTRLTDAEQKLARRGGGDRPQAEKSVGAQFVENERVKSFLEDGRSGSVKIGVKSITSLPASAGDLVVEDRVPGIVTQPLRRFTIRDLLTPGSTASNAIEYVEETGFTNNAAPQSEGDQKAESAVSYDLKTVGVKTIAHFMHVSKQILDDSPQLQSQIDFRLRYGLQFVEEMQLLKGDGTGPNIHGIIPQASAYSAPITVSGETKIDRLRISLLQAELAEYPATGIVLHPSDWAEIELTKDTQGRYIFANPQQMAGPSLWGRPVVATQAMDEGDFLTGAFMLGAQIFDREQAAVELSTEDRDNFIKNMITIRGEERLALAVYRPEAFNTGAFA